MRIVDFTLSLLFNKSDVYRFDVDVIDARWSSFLELDDNVRYLIIDGNWRAFFVGDYDVYWLFYYVFILSDLTLNFLSDDI